MGCPVRDCTLKHLNLSEHFAWQRSAPKRAVPVINAPVANAVANEERIIANETKDVANGVKSTRERVAKWRKVHREEYNAKMREYRKRVRG